MSVILSILGWIISFFRPSNDKKLGKLEEVNKEQGEILEEVKDAEKIRTDVTANPSAYGVSKFQRD